MSRFLSLLLVSLLSIAAPALAEDQPAPTQAQLDDAYQQLLKDPQNQTLLVKYANTAIGLKNYEAAIPPLESLLMSDPDDADLKVKIGLLYMNLGSKMMAQHYFEDARDTPDASQDTKDKADAYLRQL